MVCPKCGKTFNTSVEFCDMCGHHFAAGSVPPAYTPPYPPTYSAPRPSHGMFGNMGNKIKALARVVAWIGIIFSCLGGLSLIIQGMDYEISGLILGGFLIAGIGSLLSWISSFALYGFGQIVDNTDKLVNIAEEIKNKK